MRVILSSGIMAIVAVFVSLALIYNAGYTDLIGGWFLIASTLVGLVGLISGARALTEIISKADSADTKAEQIANTKLTQITSKVMEVDY